MDVLFNSGINKDGWTLPTIEGKLRDLEMAKKNQYWVQKDMEISPSSCLGRFFWTVIAKRFDCLREWYYIDPKVTVILLERLWVHLLDQRNAKLEKLYFSAIANFEAITGYSVGISTANPHPYSISFQNIQSSPQIIEQPVIVERPVNEDRSIIVERRHSPAFIPRIAPLPSRVRPEPINADQRPQHIPRKVFADHHHPTHSVGPRISVQSVPQGPIGGHIPRKVYAN